MVQSMPLWVKLNMNTVAEKEKLSATCLSGIVVSPPDWAPEPRVQTSPLTLMVSGRLMSIGAIAFIA